MHQGPALHNIVITATSGVTAVGANIQQTCAAINAGITPFVEHAYITCTPSDPEWDEDLPTYVATAPFINPFLNTSERLTLLAIPAITDIFTQSKLKRTALASTGLFLALPLADNGTKDLVLDERWLNDVKRQTGLGGLACFKLSNTGNIGVFSLINTAIGLLNSGELEQCIIGGVDSYLIAERMAYFDQQYRVNSVRNVDGFIPGEAAGMLLLETKANANKRGVKALAQISGVGEGSEEKHFNSQLSSNGEGLTTAITNAVLSNGVMQTVTSIYCDFNGESYYAQEWGLMHVRLASLFNSVRAFNHPADCYGNVGAASGGLLLANAVEHIQQSGAVSQNILVATANDNNQRSTILLSNVSSSLGN
jgi:3-oxoacyl-[acyl-carrier-protein] synthase-1